MKKGSIDHHRALKTTHILFYGGLALGLLGTAFGAMTDSVPIMLIISVIGFAGIIGGLFFAHAHVRCPHCYGSLLWGGRIPSHLPTYCPHCGKPL